jgi:hypothetical protein
MSKRKTAEADVMPAESTQRAQATKPKAAAAMHKRATPSRRKKTTEPVLPASEPVRAISTNEISRRAYSYWEARGYQGGSPEEDWFRAERELLESTQNR